MTRGVDRLDAREGKVPIHGSVSARFQRHEASFCTSKNAKPLESDSLLQGIFTILVHQPEHV